MFGVERIENGSFPVEEGRRYQIEDVNFADIRWKSGTFRYSTEKKPDGTKITRTRSGVSTPIGDIEENVWYQVAKALIQRAGEEALFQQMKEWCKEQIGWLRTPKEVEHYAAELHVSRIFDNPEWVDFIPFNAKFRPDALVGVETVVVQTECCKKDGAVTRAQIENAYGGRVCCPYCGRFSEYSCEDPKYGKQKENSASDDPAPSAEEIGAATVVAVKRVIRGLSECGIKYRILDVKYKGPDGETYNLDSPSYSWYIPFAKEGRTVGVLLSYKCKRTGRQLRKLVKEKPEALKKAGGQVRDHGVIFYFLLKDLQD